MAARYLSKYMGKDLERPRTSGLHRYEVAQGFQPPVVAIDGQTVEAVLDTAAEMMGGPPARVWRSDEEDSWDKPPAVWAQWDQ